MTPKIGAPFDRQERWTGGVEYVMSTEDIEYIVSQFSTLDEAAKRELWENLRGFVLPEIKAHTGANWLHNGQPITQNAAGVAVGWPNDHRGDVIDIIGGSARWHSDVEARRLQISMGAGADCMFDVLVSSCWAAEVAAGRGVEGEQRTSLSGCTFRICSTVTQGVSTLFNLGGTTGRTMFICRGDYVENISGQNFEQHITIIGAGIGATRIIASSSASPTWRPGGLGGAGFTFMNLTLRGNGSNQVLETTTGHPCYIQNVQLEPQSGGAGLHHGGGERLVNVTIVGTSAASGISHGTEASGLQLSNVRITGCAIGITGTSVRRVQAENVVISNATTAGIRMFGNNAFCYSTFSKIRFESCAKGLEFIGPVAESSVWTDLIFHQCAIGIDLSTVHTGVNGVTISDSSFFTTSSAHIGIKADGATATFFNSQITDNNFRGYAVGKAIQGTSSLGTGTTVYHNVSGNEALADFGSPVGHVTGGNAHNHAHSALTGLSNDDHPQYALDTDLTAHVAAPDPHTGYIPESLIDAAGDLIVGSADNTPARLPGASTNGHVLTWDSADPLRVKWAAPSGGGGGHTIRENGVDQTQRANLNFIDTDAGAGLITDDAANNETEINLNLYTLKSLLTTRGDIYVRNASTVARLPLGADNTVLKSDGTDAIWGALDANDVTGINIRQTLSLMAAGGHPALTAGCAPLTRVEAPTNDVDYWVLDFDQSIQEHAFWNVAMPDNYDGGTLTVQFIWTTAATSGNVIWGIQLLCRGDDDAIDTAWGTAVEVTDGFLAAGDVHISAVSAAITPGGAAAPGDMLFARVYRKAADAGDTLNGDARLIAARLEYTTAGLSA